jgi:DNA-directed RNA polymerase subunit RPC12/RpoP
VIKFDCKNCGGKFSVPEIHAGKKGKCPKCKNVILIPQIQDTSPLTTQSKTSNQKSAPKDSPHDLTLLEVPQKDRTQGQSTIQKYKEDPEEEPKIDQPEPVPKRKLPWIIDIFLYPMSVPGLVTLGIIIGIPLLIDITAMLFGIFGFFIAIPGLFAKIVVGLYLYWYIAECIRDSATGGLRAPETLGRAPGLGDMFLQLLEIVGCFALCFAPLLIYYQQTRNTDAIFWSLFAYAVFFFPMGLLSVVMFDSFSGLNPLLLIGSIFRTFFPYCAMVVALLLAGFLTTIITSAALQQSFVLALVLDFLIRCIHPYLLLVTAHLLGRFYWRYQEKLRWEV